MGGIAGTLALAPRTSHREARIESNRIGDRRRGAANDSRKGSAKKEEGGEGELWPLGKRRV
jgi:hypothetical protein